MGYFSSKRAMYDITRIFIKKAAFILMQLDQKHTFRSLNVLVAEKRTEMGKNTDESAGGTTNSIDPLPTVPQKYKITITINTSIWCICNNPKESTGNYRPAVRVINKKNRPFQYWIPGIISAMQLLTSNLHKISFNKHEYIKESVLAEADKKFQRITWWK